MPGFNANFRNSGSPTQILSDDGDARGIANPYPIFPPPPQPILMIDCGQSVTDSISTASQRSQFRTSNPISNQGYYARVFNIVIEPPEAEGSELVTFTVTAGFDIFIALVRDSEHQYYSSDGSGVLTVTVDSSNSGPFILEVTTLSPGETGSFTVTQTCKGTVLHWSFEGDLVDDNLGQSLSGLSVLFTPGLIGDGVESNTSASFSQMVLDLPTPNPLQDYSSGDSFSQAFWVKFSDAGVGFPSFLAQLNMDGVDGHAYEVDFLVGGDLAGPGLANPGAILAQDPSLAGPRPISYTIPVTFVTGTWYFIVLTYDGTLHKLGVSINNAAYVYSTSAFTLPDGTWNHVNIQWGGGGAFPINGPNGIIDEYLITTDYGLDVGDINYLFNAGAGVAWPYSIPTPGA